MKMGLAGARPSKRTPCMRQLLSVDQIDSMLVAAAFEGSVEPGANDFESGFNADHSLAKGKHVGIIVPPAQGGRFEVPAQGAADAFDAIGNDGFAVAGATEDDSALEFAAGDGFGDWPNEQGIVHR